MPSLGFQSRGHIREVVSFGSTGTRGVAGPAFSCTNRNAESPCRKKLIGRRRGPGARGAPGEEPLTGQQRARSERGGTVFMEGATVEAPEAAAVARDLLALG